MTLHSKPSVALFIIIISIGMCAHATDLVWIGGTGNWNLAGNWSPAQIPTTADNTWITNSGTYTVTVPAGSVANANSLVVGGKNGVQTLAIDRATTTLSAQSTINSNGVLSLLVSQSVLTGAGDLIVNGSLNWANGTISGSGALNIGSNGSMSIGSGGVTLSRILNNSGTSTWAGGNFTFSTGATLNNLVGATFDITADGRLSGSATTPINNSGLLRLTAGTTGTTITAPLNNNASLQVLASTLNLNLGGTGTGAISNASGAILNLGGGNHVLSATASVTGAGVLSVSGTGTTLSAAAMFNPGTTLNVTAGTVTLEATCNITAATVNVTGNGAVVSYNSTGTIGALSLSGGTLGGSSPINVTGPLGLGGGTITNPLVTANGGLTISGNTTLNGTKLINPGTAIWSAGNVVGANGAVFSNLLGATFINTFDGNMNLGSGATPVFVNQGTFQKTNGTAALGVTSIDFQFINTGTVEVRTNTLRYSLNQQTAGLTLLNGGNLAAQAQPLQISGGSLVGFGSVTLANVQNVINAASISPGLPIGELDISGNYQQTTAGTLNIDLGGYVPGTGFDLITVAAGGGGGNATVGGTLNVALTNGFFPTNGATFTFLTANTRAGAFSTFNFPWNDIGMQLSYAANSVSVKVTNLKPTVANPISDPAPVVYGGTFNLQFAANTFSDPDNDSLTYTASGMPPGITFDGPTRTFSGAPTEAGVFPITVTATDSGVPSLSATNLFTITVDPATLTVTANSQTKIYGANDPVLTFAVSGLQLTDTAASVLIGALDRTSGENVTGSPYAITQGTLHADSNYIISFTGNSLTITPAPLSVTADDKTKTYGAIDPAFTVHYGGFVNNETPAVLSGTLGFNRASGENVGNYTVTPTGLIASNYAIIFNTGTLSITKAPLSITATNATKIYGAEDPTFGVAYSAFVNGDNAGALGGTLVINRAPGENVGSYLITPGGLTSSNYALTFNTGTLTITNAAVTVTANATNKIYGHADPSFTVNYSGFVNGENSSVLGGTLSFTRTPGETVGNYLITPAGLTSSNYSITFNTASLTISKAPLSVTAVAQTKTYGTIDPSLTFLASGFQFTDSAATVLTGALSRSSGESVAGSPYSITQGTLAPNTNYTINFTSNTLSITPAPLIVTADDKTKSYGSTDPVFTVTYSGFANGETNNVLGGTLTFTRAPGENVADYSITPGGLTSTNYAITFHNGRLSITKRNLSVTADAKAKTYGSIDPPFTASYFGFVNQETPAVLTGTLGFVRVAGENVGNYAITPNGLFSSNYSITFNTGTLSITKAALSVTANDVSKPFGAADPPFTARYSGFVNGDTSAALSGTLAFTRTSGETVGDYSITPSGLTSSNYTITFNTGTLTITITAPPQIFPIAGAGIDNIVISWSSVSNVTYRIQYSTNLNSSWLDLLPDITATNTIASTTDHPTGATMRFYRVFIP